MVCITLGFFPNSASGNGIWALGSGISKKNGLGNGTGTFPSGPSSKIIELPYLTFKLKGENKTCPLPLSGKISSASLIFSVTFLLLLPARLLIEFFKKGEISHQSDCVKFHKTTRWWHSSRSQLYKTWLPWTLVDSWFPPLSRVLRSDLVPPAGSFPEHRLIIEPIRPLCFDSVEHRTKKRSNQDWWNVVFSDLSRTNSIISARTEGIFLALQGDSVLFHRETINLLLNRTTFCLILFCSTIVLFGFNFDLINFISLNATSSIPINIVNVARW